MTFGERLADLRTEKKLTQTELANQTSISRSRLSLYETDKREPDLQTLVQLANFFDVSTDYLLGISDKRIPADCSTTADDLIKRLPEDAKKSLDDFRRYILQKHGVKEE